MATGSIKAQDLTFGNWNGNITIEQLFGYMNRSGIVIAYFADANLTGWAEAVCCVAGIIKGALIASSSKLLMCFEYASVITVYTLVDNSGG